MQKTEIMGRNFDEEEDYIDPRDIESDEGRFH